MVAPGAGDGMRPGLGGDGSGDFSVGECEGAWFDAGGMGSVELCIGPDAGGSEPGAGGGGPSTGFAEVSGTGR